MLRALLRLIPCRPSESARFRASVLSVARRPPESGAAADALLRETHFLLDAQQHLQVLNERYFPSSGMTPQEVVTATAARVGFKMPKTAPVTNGDDASAKE